MIVVVFSGRQGGGAFTFQVVKATLELGGHDQAKLQPELVRPKSQTNVVGNWTDARLERLLSVTRGQCLAVRTRGGPDRLTTGALFRAIESKELKIIVTYRDPRETVLSLLPRASENSREEDVSKAIAVLRDALRNLRHWGSFPSLKVCFDDLLADPTAGVTLIVDELALTVDVAEVVERAIASGAEGVRAPSTRRNGLASEDAARIEAAVPNYLRLVEQRDLSWFHRVG